MCAGWGVRPAAAACAQRCIFRPFTPVAGVLREITHRYGRGMLALSLNLHPRLVLPAPPRFYYTTFLQYCRPPASTAIVTDTLQ
ncbi:unnamed protein product [Euphydryas editha]|uniref:Secreted protein n=1 Tax=Euphydryas editha TaxID=104508 RepID=A0AAU9TXJ4_EUPED|nr:unnamed protein product [Euphydryas editha]